jgi:hypothetical protein
VSYSRKGATGASCGSHRGDLCILPSCCCLGETYESQNKYAIFINNFYQISFYHCDIFQKALTKLELISQWKGWKQQRPFLLPRIKLIAMEFSFQNWISHDWSSYFLTFLTRPCTFLIERVLPVIFSY